MSKTKMTENYGKLRKTTENNMKIPKNTIKLVTNVTPSHKRNKAKMAIKKDPLPSPFVCHKSVVLW